MHDSNVLQRPSRSTPVARRSGLTLVACVATAALLACDNDRAPLSPVTRTDAAADAKAEVPRSPNPTGQLGTVSNTGEIDRGNPFFQSLGTNGRSCASCHIEGSAFGLSAQAAQAAFAASGGRDP
ncbi:MAG: hypothetical protein ACTHM9_08650, partial [Gemmatimonadales bacterium]